MGAGAGLFTLRLFGSGLRPGPFAPGVTASRDGLGAEAEQGITGLAVEFKLPAAGFGAGCSGGANLNPVVTRGMTCGQNDEIGFIQLLRCIRIGKEPAAACAAVVSPAAGLGAACRFFRDAFERVLMLQNRDGAGLDVRPVVLADALFAAFRGLGGGFDRLPLAPGVTIGRDLDLACAECFAAAGADQLIFSCAGSRAGRFLGNAGVEPI